MTKLVQRLDGKRRGAGNLDLRLELTSLLQGELALEVGVQIDEAKPVAITTPSNSPTTTATASSPPRRTSNT